MDPIKQRSLAALGMAILSGLGCFLWLKHSEDALLKRGKPMKILVARRYIAAMTRLEASQLAWREIPSEYAPKGAIENGSDAVGQLTLVPFSDGEPLLYNKLSRSDQALSSAVPEGMRGFTVPVDQVSGVAGLLRPGDLVDMLFIPDSAKNPASSATTLFQSVKVLAAGTSYAEDQKANEKETSSSSVTLAMSPEDSQVALLALSRGQIHLSLRGPGDSHVLNLNPAAASDLAGRSHTKRISSTPQPDSFIPSKR